MTTSLAPLPRQAFGPTFAGYKLFTYAAGTLTKQNSYTDSTGATPNTNPIILDANGSASVWFTPGLLYKEVLALPTDTDPPTVPIWTADNLPGAIDAGTATYTPPGSNVVVTTVTGDLSAGYYNVFRTMTSAQIAAVQAGALAQDVTTAVQNALNNWGEVYFGPGRYPIGLATLTLAQGMKIRGAGKNLTYFVGPATNLTLFTIGTGVALNEVAIMDATIYWTGAQTTSAGIAVFNGHQIHLHDLRINAPFVGVDWNGGAQQDSYLANNIEILNPAIGMRTGNDGSQVADLYVDHFSIGSATTAGILLQNNSGFYFNQGSIISSACGFRIQPLAGKSVTAGLCSGVLCDGSTGNGWEFVNLVGSDISDAVFNHCWAASCGTALASAGTENGIWISASGGPIDDITFNSWLILSNKGAGIQYDSGKRIQIKNCSIIENSQVSLGTRSGVEVGAAASDFLINDNNIGIGGRIGVVTSFVLTQKYGITIANGCTRFDLRGNDVFNNITGNIQDLSAAGATKRISQNRGYNPIATTTITLGASPATWTNNTGDTAVFICNGGTVSSITLAGVQVATGTTVSIVVPQGEAVVVTYSGAPTQVFYRGC